MKLFEHYPNEDGTRRWRGKCDNYRIAISECFNKELGYVDKYSFHATKFSSLTDYRSEEHNEFYPTVDECVAAVYRFIVSDKQRVSFEHIRFKKELKGNAKAREDKRKRTRPNGGDGKRG